MRKEALAPIAAVTAAERRAILAARSIWEFDDRFSAPRNGFAGAADYYERSAARHYLAGIAVPTLVIHALDDPWIPSEPYRDFAMAAQPEPRSAHHRARRACRLRGQRPTHRLARSGGRALPRNLGQPALRRFAASTAE